MKKKDTCIMCDVPLEWGQFTYNQNLCWDCFKEQVQTLAKNQTNASEARMILHLLACVAEMHGIMGTV